ncbi:hypothetical protein SK128_008780 [Halocaridina rubra]|uniref:C-type lectin domain-containing protein n=1 Tax=Halocaridina rubra TaxID=373956 RepID=A0AAN8XA40_HALRR
MPAAVYQRETSSQKIRMEAKEVIPEGSDKPTLILDNNLSSASLDEACSMDRNCELKDEYSRCGDENTCVCKDGYRKQVFPQVGSYCTVYVPVPPTPPVIDPKAPCSFPYVEIAYKMCILPELEQRLTWVDAVDYCRALGLELAYDSVVIKARRYFNDLLGESGTRERWPIWIGGKQETNEAGESHWVWTDGTSVPSFLWQEGKPRTWVDTYSGGLCMIMDGYAQYYPDSLPCHYKRRFVCQRLS